MPAPLYLAMADVAHLYRVHPGTARRWARQDSWRRTTVRPIRYHAGDAQASFDKRHGDRTTAHLATRYAAS